VVEDAPVKSAGSKTYVVAKGDNLTSIARKFKVPYDDIMTSNSIDDPRKLKIGQKLVIPKVSQAKEGRLMNILTSVTQAEQSVLGPEFCPSVPPPPRT
jgi:LysM repeat protein